MSGPKNNKMPRHFFFHEDLHRRLHINKGGDVISCWSFPAGEIKKYSYTDVKRNYERAFTTKEVCALVMRGRSTVEMAIVNGNINRPPIAYHLKGDRQEYAYYWHEKNIMELHAFLATIHRGRPRKDGFITVQKMPNARELRALIRQNLVYYVEDSEGNFIPTWDAKF